jgi:uncharacterized radical SAM superfamily Fe-S cluster-containing enzyme
MPSDRAAWSALECDDVSIYVRPEKADWFVPNAAGCEVLERLSGGEARLSLPDRVFLDRLPDDEPVPYRGRRAEAPESLSELWLHVTNRCNLACTHCIFDRPIRRR